MSINIWSKKHLDIKQAESYLKKCRTYLEAIGYNVVYAQENWSNPKLLKNLPCIRFVDSEKQNLMRFTLEDMVVFIMFLLLFTTIIGFKKSKRFRIIINQYLLSPNNSLTCKSANRSSS